MSRRSMVARNRSPFTNGLLNTSLFDQEFHNMIEGLEDIWQGRTASQNEFGNIKETDSAYLLSVDMPGVKKEDMTIEVDDGVVSIKGERKTLFENGGGETQTFSRRLSVPATIKKDEVQAQLQDGILYLALPKSATSKSKKIEVKDASDNFVKLFSDSERKSSGDKKDNH